MDINLQNLETYSEEVKECWAAHEALARLGFKGRNIWTIANEQNKKFTLFVSLRTQDKEFNIAIRENLTRTEAEIALNEWKKFAGHLISGHFPKDSLFRIYESSKILKRGEELVRALLSRGFVIPKRSN